MIDSHCHLNLPPLASSINDVLLSAAKQGVTRIMAPGVDPASWRLLQHYSDTYNHIVPIDTALGLHPYFLLPDGDAGAGQEQTLEHNITQLEKAAASLHPSVKAIGETGLDRHIDVPMIWQQRILDVHLTIASDLNRPVILHHRKSHHLLLAMLKQTRFQMGGVIHAFSGSIEVAKRYIELGFYLGVGGTITYERASKTRNTAAFLVNQLPHRLLLETDAPDMPLHGRQGHPNKPQYLGEVVTALAKLGGTTETHIINATSANYRRLFLS